MSHEYDYFFKVLLIGDTGIGKSSLLVRFADNVFTDNFMPSIGVDFKIKTLMVDNKLAKLQIWEPFVSRFNTITSSYFKGAHGVLVTYDITDRESFQAVQKWMGQVKQHASDSIACILVGNKCDLES